MTTMAIERRGAGGPGRSLEALVDRVMDALLGQHPAAPRSVARSVHDARRLRRSGDLAGALTVLGGVDMRGARDSDARWAHAEWLGLARRRFAGREALVYSQGGGRAAVLRPAAGGMLAVEAAIGMRWSPGKVVSRRSLRGLRPLSGVGR